ncbi:glycosyltransferase family 4 protein [Synechococcus lacustris Tous-12m]
MNNPVPQLTVNLWGHLSGGFGLGEGARCTARALTAAGVRVQWRDLPLATHVNDQPLDAAEQFQAAAIDLIHTNPNVLRQTDGIMQQIDLKAPLRIGFWAWELESFPNGWEPGFCGLDQLWCPSSFCASSLGLRSPIPVTPLPHLIDWDRAQRLRLLRSSSASKVNKIFNCLFAFDFWSTVGRKNPHGVIDAFQLAFPMRRNWGSRTPEARLVLKLSSSAQFPDATEALQQRAQADQRIKLISDHLNNQEFDQLYREADVLVSLHRAEGFGLSLAEAMAAELPVVSTGYSGNLDFMPTGSAELIPYKLTKISKTEGDYRAGELWAEPDLDAAAKAIRNLAENADYRKQLAKSGRKAVESNLNITKISNIVRERLGCLIAKPGRAELVRQLPSTHPWRTLDELA